MARALAPALCALVVGLAACGGNGDGDGDARTTPRTRDQPNGQPTPTPKRPVTADEKAVIRAWTDALRAGHVTEAARWFSLPTTVANGHTPLTLTTREAVREFNRGLTCGARVVRIESAGRYALATFRLTERPGGGKCGSGTGEKAQTAFLIRKRRIVQWLRVVETPTAEREDADPSA